MITDELFAARRQALFQRMDQEAILILKAADEILRTNETAYPFRQNNDFYYFTGFEEPGAVAVFMPGRTEGQYLLFNQPHDPQKEQWVGAWVGQEGAVEQFHADQSFPISALDEKMLELLVGRRRLYFPIGEDPVFDARVIAWAQKLQGKTRQGVDYPCEFLGLDDLVHEMRVEKSSEEIALIRQSVEISALAHRRLMQFTKPKQMEYELEAEFMHVCGRYGVRALSYDAIVAGAERGCCLHYEDNSHALNEGDLVLVDMGGEYQKYASDITRTFPVNGHFTAAQRAVYEAVLIAQKKVIQAVHPGVRWDQLQQLSEELITEQLIKLGILKGDIASCVKEKAFFPFYMHRIGHFMGLAVHDVGRYRLPSGWRELKSGMVFTVEPGIYIAKENKQVDEKWRGIAIRIEDDILVTDKGHEVLSHQVPKEVDEVEALCCEV